MKVTIDRITDGIALVEYADGKTEKLPAALLPEGAQEGDILELTLLPQERKSRENRIQTLMDEVFK
ncbi:MAG: DUF3006 domain-containing protein [Clostridia bacterium]|nr:DUF3006 domain-containing protein [Clostridia bacterium]